MPIPMISAQIMASSKFCEDGWSLLELMAVRTEQAKSGKSVNYFWEFQAIQGPGNTEENKDRRITNTVNGAGLAAGITQACANYIGMVSALTGLSGEEVVGKELDEQALIGKKMWADIGERKQDGKTYKELRAFSPANQIPF